MLLRRGPDAISPTAHFTGAVWAHHGLGAPGLATWEGRIARTASAPLMAVSARLGGPTLEGFLLARHRVMDHLLEEAIADGRVGSVVELAAGMSPRCLALAERFGSDVTCVETDLPAMAARKRRALARLGAGGPHHAVAELDVLRTGTGPGTLAAVTAGLDRSRGLAVVTEGLLNYLPPAAVTDLWARIAGIMGEFAGGLYVSDLHLREENGRLADGLFTAGLGAAVGGRIHFHFRGAGEAGAALREAGFARATLHRTAAFADRLPGVDGPGSEKVRVVEATVPAERVGEGA